MDGACNRAYYAMFDAARAALLVECGSIDTAGIKTHSGLISAFGLHLVKTGRVPIELGKALNKAEELRLLADYKEEPVEAEYAAWAVATAQDFIRAMQESFTISPRE